MIYIHTMLLWQEFFDLSSYAPIVLTADYFTKTLQKIRDDWVAYLDLNCAAVYWAGSRGHPRVNSRLHACRSQTYHWHESLSGMCESWMWVAK